MSYSFLLSVAGLGLFMIATPASAQNIVAPNGAVSFVDDFAIEKMSDLKRTLEQPGKRSRPVLVAEAAWESNPYLFGTVLRDSLTGMYRMWYMSYNRGKPPLERTPVLYAESKDGITWKKPSLGLHAFGGSKENNIVLNSLGFHDLYSPSVLEDAGAKDPSRRFKMIFWDKTGEDSYRDGGMHVAFSPDGIHWTRYEKNPVLKAGRHENAISDVMDLTRDPVTGKFLVYAKGWNKDAWKPDGKENKDLSQRIVLRSESTDFVNWSRPQPVIRHARTPEDPQSYGMPVFYADGVFLGLLRSYKLPGDERIDIRLMSSRDGVNWSPVCQGETFLSTGAGDSEWDDGMIFTAPAMVDGGKLRIYYGGWDGPHESRYRHSAIGLAEMPAGRLAGLTPKGKTGSLTTRPFEGQDRKLLVNAVLGDGSCKVAVEDASGRELPDFRLGDCELAPADEGHLEVRWKTRAELPSQAIRLRFEVSGQARLYGFRLVRGTKSSQLATHAEK